MQLKRLAYVLGTCVALSLTASLRAQEQPSNTDPIATESMFGGFRIEDETGSYFTAASQQPSAPDSSTISPDQPPLSRSPYAGTWDKRRYLTANWGGVRDSLVVRGFAFDASLAQFYQGLVAGTGDHSFEYGGKAKLTTVVDASKLGLWSGFSVIVGGEYNYGRTASYAGHTFLPTNTAMTFPSLNENGGDWMTVAVSQRFGERLSVVLGKVNAFDAYAAGHKFSGGGGLDRFQHIVFAGTPSGTVPVCMFGGFAVLKTQLAEFTLMIYDPDDKQHKSGLDHPFKDGVTFYGTMGFDREFRGLPGKYTFGASTSTETGVDLANLPDVSLPPGSVAVLSEKSGRWYVNFSFEQAMWQSVGDAKKAWGLFGQASLSDGNPNLQKWLVMGGVGGTSPIPGRGWDKFGVGAFCYGLSKYLIDGLAPAVKVGDECGGEAFYNYAATPWFLVSADLEVVKPAERAYATAVLFGLRAQIRL